MVDRYLKTSVLQYRAVLEHAETLADLLSHGDLKKVAEYMARLQELQQEAGSLDQAFLAEVDRLGANWQAHPLYQERMQLLEQVVALNENQLPKISGMKAVVAAELGELRAGRGALSGYGATLKNTHRSSRGIG